MVKPQEDGTFVGDYILRGEVEVSKELLQSAIVRMESALSLGVLFGTCTTWDQYNDMILKSPEKYLDPTCGSKRTIKIHAVKIIEDEDGNLGFRIAFEPLRDACSSDYIFTIVRRWILNGALKLLPRMLATRDKDGKAVRMDIVTFDVVSHVPLLSQDTIWNKWCISQEAQGKVLQKLEEKYGTKEEEEKTDG